ncbi:MAG: hypothetical protein ACI3W5_04285 [Faecousia sp.]
MLRWDKADIPHKGWEYIGMEDLGEDVYPGDPIPYEQCEMCGKEKIRYVHLLKHPDYNGEIRVGCDCASKMICDYVTPQERERNLKNRVNRRKNFMKQEWYRKPETGNYTLRYKGDNITIMRSKFGPGWGVIYKGRTQWEYHGRKITDFDTARTVAFNLFDEFYESRHQEQPYWDGNRWIYV